MNESSLIVEKNNYRYIEFFVFVLIILENFPLWCYQTTIRTILLLKIYTNILKKKNNKAKRNRISVDYLAANICQQLLFGILYWKSWHFHEKKNKITETRIIHMLILINSTEKQLWQNNILNNYKSWTDCSTMNFFQNKSKVFDCNSDTNSSNKIDKHHLMSGYLEFSKQNKNYLLNEFWLIFFLKSIFVLHSIHLLRICIKIISLFGDCS